MRVPRELLRETISVEAYSGQGARGPAFAAPATMRAQCQATNRLVTTAHGVQVGIDQLVVIRPENGPIPVESRVTYRGIIYRVILAYPYPDDRRPYYYELSLQKYVSDDARTGSGS